MLTSAVDSSRISRAAVFVDFDNVYLGLKSIDATAAENFATNPARWLDLISEADGTPRRFLVRNCYLNPSAFSKYRSYWTQAGFRVVDCPSLTQAGKSSTDINLVLEAVDLLVPPVGIDEFFLASADADFTALIQRFRAAGLLSTVVIAGHAASPYRNMADVVVEPDDIVAILAADSLVAPSTTKSTETPVNPKAALAVMDTLKAATGPVAAATLAHRARAAVPGIQANWEGRKKFQDWLLSLGDTIGTGSRDTILYAWDTSRFSDSDLPAERSSQPAIQGQVSRVTDVPQLTKAQYGQVFIALAGRLPSTDGNAISLARHVRDDCDRAGEQVSSTAIGFIFRSLETSGVDFARAAVATDLAGRWATQVMAVSNTARMEFDPDERAAVIDWVSGGLVSAV